LVRNDYTISAAHPAGKEEQIIRLIDQTQLVPPKLPFKPIHSPVNRHKARFKIYNKAAIQELLNNEDSDE
jgi:hypothetical protein